MHQITTGLSEFKRDPHLEKVLSLLTSLDRLCEPLFHEDVEVISQSNPQMQRPAETPPTVRIFPNAWDNIDLGQDTSNSEIGASTDWLMWQLFNSEVPLGWLNPDFPIL